MSVECFLIEPTNEVVPTLVVIEDGECPNSYGHRATHEYPREPLSEHEREDGLTLTDNMPDLDAPEYAQVTNCERCGHEFTEAAKRSATVRRVWRSPTGEEHSNPHDFGPGAMWNAYWMPGAEDGAYLVVVCPDGAEWHIDGPSRDGGGWTRTGVPPKVTVKPSVQTNVDYHGFLRDGKFT